MKAYLKVTLLSLLISIVTTSVWAIPTQCPSGASFTHKPGQTWQWNQPYPSWWRLLDYPSKTSQLRTFPADWNLLVTTVLPFKVVCCDYYKQEEDSHEFQVGNQQPYLIPFKLTSGFKPSTDPDDIKGTYICTTKANTPELCSWG